MKRVCNRPIQIDALTLCYEIQHTLLYDELCALKFGDCLDMNEFDYTEQRADITITFIPSDYGMAHVILSGDTLSSTLHEVTKIATLTPTETKRCGSV